MTLINLFAFYYFWKMEILILIGIGILLLLGIIGCFVPIIPGPPISYGGLLVFHFFSSYSIEENILWLMAFCSFCCYNF